MREGLARANLNLPPFTSVIEALEHWSKENPTKEYCLISDMKGGEERVTFKDLYEESQRYAQWLKEKGLSKGERVVLAIPNSRSFLASFLGTLMAGGVAVPVCARDRLLQSLDKASETIAYIFRDCAAKYILTTESNKTLCERAIKSVCGDTETVISLVERFPEEVHFRSNPLKIFPEDLAFIQYTSGSTSLPKGVMINHEQLMAQLRSIVHGLKSSAKDIAVSWLPLFHDMGLVGAFLHSLYVGMRLVLMSPEKFIFDPKEWLLAISKYKATMSSGPNSAYKLCATRIRAEDIQGLDLSSWRVAFTGAEPISVNALETFDKQFRPYGFNSHAFVAGYGMAENCLAITFQKPGAGLKYDCIDRQIFEKEKRATPIELNHSEAAMTIVSCGKPVLGNEIRIVDDKGKILGERQAGEVIVRGPSVMQGYFKKESETENTIRCHWLYTGDVGYLAQGELYITGRKKDMIIKGGRNYCPQDIESVVEKVEGVRGGAVLAVGIYDEGGATEKMVVLAETKPSFYKKKEVLILNIRKAISEAIGISPDEIHLYPRGTFQRTTSGKVQREKHKQLFLSGKLKERVTLRDRLRYFKFRLHLLISMFFYYLSSWVKRRRV